jgi:hypothetical protein
MKSMVLTSLLAAAIVAPELGCAVHVPGLLLGHSSSSSAPRSPTTSRSSTTSKSSSGASANDDHWSNETKYLVHEIAELYRSDGSPDRVKIRESEQMYSASIGYGATNESSVRLDMDVTLPRISWKRGETHKLGELKKVIAQARTDDETSDLTSALARDARHAWEPYRKNFTTKGVADCLMRYDHVHEANIPDSTVVAVDADKDNPLKSGTHTVGELHAYCLASQAKLEHDEKTRAVGDKLAKNVAWLTNAVVRVKTIPMHLTNVKDLTGLAESCVEGVDEALAAGLPPEYVIDVGYGDTGFKGPVSAIKKDVCPRATEVLQQETKLWEAQIAPYRKVLKNDKLQYIIDYDFAWYLSGGKSTDDPGQLARSSVWLNIMTGGTNPKVCADGQEVQTLWRYQFDREQKMVRSTTQEYCGDPPHGAYR